MKQHPLEHIRQALQKYRVRNQILNCDRKMAEAITKINNATKTELYDAEYIATLIREVGLARDERGIYGEDDRFMNPIPRGLWQIPKQLADFCVFLSDKNIRSFLEIGTFTGYTFTFLAAYLFRINPELKSYTVDTFNLAPYKAIAYPPYNATFVIGDSTAFTEVPFDLCLIDGDHSLDAVRSDYERVGKFAKICAFHDINDKLVADHPQNNGGVPRFWIELKNSNEVNHVHEFTWHSQGRRVMGIGALLQKN